jgi:hypothetical protein
MLLILFLFIRMDTFIDRSLDIVLYSYYRVSRPRRPAAKPRRCYREASREPLAPARLVTTLLCYLSRITESITESEAAGV